jgi:hypothetical protein
MGPRYLFVRRWVITDHLGGVVFSSDAVKNDPRAKWMALPRLARLIAAENSDPEHLPLHAVLSREAIDKGLAQ